MPRPTPKLMPWAWSLAGLAALAAFPFAAGVSHALQASVSSGREPLEASMRRQDNRKFFEKLNIQRQKDMALETTRLLALANRLKAETDGSSANAFSVNSVREAEQIEKLARDVRAKMGAAVGN